MKNYAVKILIIALLLIYPLSNATHLLSAKESTPSDVEQESDISALEELDKQNVAVIEEKIEKLNIKKQEKRREQELRQQRANNINLLLQQIKNGDTSYRKIMKGTVIAGDSLMHGMYEYDVLDKTYLVTKVSASLGHLESNLDTIIGLNPKVLVVHYGLNNMSTDETATKNFISKYESLLLELHKSLPKTRIVVSSVFNIAPEKAKGSFADIPKFNNMLKKMCIKNKFEFLDNNDLLPGDGSYLEKDGMHVIKKFYTQKFLPNLIVELGL